MTVACFMEGFLKNCKNKEEVAVKFLEKDLGHAISSRIVDIFAESAFPKGALAEYSLIKEREFIGFDISNKSVPAYDIYGHFESYQYMPCVTIYFL